MKIQAPPGMRDFYPAEMRLQTWLFDAWRRVSRSFGFEEFEGPIFEYLDLYTTKSGEGIVSELFTFEDRGERRFAIRPEMTPTLARMVAAKANALPRPIKWFSIPRMCRAEKPQRGRLREFFQWNVDVLDDDVAERKTLADAEVIATAAEFFRSVGCTPSDLVIEVNSRPLASALLASLNVAEARIADALILIDRFEKLPYDEFAKRWNAEIGGAQPETIKEKFIDARIERADLVKLAGGLGSAGAADIAVLQDVLQRSAAFGVADFLEVRPGLARGLAYYTGTIFEIRDRRRVLRALAGGGRYDNLTELFGGPKVPGVGFGMGDAPILEFLREIKKLPEPRGQLDVFVIDAAGGDEGSSHFERALEIVRGLRQWRDAKTGDYLTVDFSYKRQPVGKQFKQADTRGARFAIIVGDETRDRGVVTIKFLETAEQKTASVDELLRNPRAVLHFPNILIA